ncbi:hypothetical protein G3I40_38550 [Streptomyces sp. SID14478]|uniref:hypothetical protein n=1 Tax=Streptomyces sp. SID14478 TaxID=2706073 RepID=UPI0013E09A35|nr:hypothetical protein [Streptomyces sp. SID14478]NEB81067.1 hypothetical protein [Streptomyces sp. SID14478]
MSAPTHSRPHPAAARGVDIRLPWWAIVLPALAFVALLLLILNPADTQAAAGDPTLGHVLERAKELVLD